MIDTGDAAFAWFTTDGIVRIHPRTGRDETLVADEIRIAGGGWILTATPLGTDGDGRA